MRKMRSGERTTIKRSNYIGIAGSMAALLGLFLPYLPGVSCLCGHKLRIASCSASAAQRRMAAPFRVGGSGGGDCPSQGLAGKKPGIRP